MPNGQPAQLANLRPWTPATAPRGKRARRSADVDKAIRLLRKLAPKAVDVIASIMLDPKQPTAMRLRAAEIILDKTWPKGAPEIITEPGRLELRFVGPTGIEYTWDEWQARGAKTAVADKDLCLPDQPPGHEPRLRVVWEAEPVTPLRGDSTSLDKVPSLRARAAAGIFR